MSWDVDEKEFYETFAEIESERGIEEAKRWAWSALDWTQKDERTAVVVFLRETLATSETAYASDDLDYAIAVIERGQHRREEKE
jgi:hypothetical protein